MNQIDKYSMYSQAVSLETKNKSDAQKVLLIINDFKELKSVENVKKYLSEKLRIKDNIQNYPITEKSYLSIIETNKIYVVRFETDSDNYSFSYRKAI